MTESANNPNRRRIFPLRKRGQQIRGHHTGNIRSDELVIIEEGAVVSGNVTAPEIRVAGLLHGTAVTYDLTIEATGQIWGDALTSQLQLLPGGRIQGWVGSLDPDTPLPNEEEPPRATALLPALPEDSSKPRPAPRSEEQLALLHRLQNAAGKAQVEYRVLKKQFDERVSEQAGNAIDKADELTHELDEAQLELKRTQKELTQAQNTLATREATIKLHTAELAEAQTRHDLQAQELADLSQSYQKLSQQHEALQAAKDHVDLSLLEALKEIDVLNEQIRTLGITLQNSIERTTEQEDALLHWQELADTTQEQVARLEKEKESLEQQLEENAVITGKLREKNSRLEFEWQQTLNEMDDLRNRLPDATMEEMQFALADARQQIATLKSLVEESRQETASIEEQVIWYKANIQTMQSALEESRVIASRQEIVLQDLQSEKASKEQTADYWKTAVEEMAARLHEREKQIKALETQHAEQNSQLETNIDQLKENLRNKSLQAQTLEAEIETHLQQMDEQGQRLAGIQATLIEHELEIEELNQKLKQAQNKITWQANFISKMKRVTSETIQQLEAELQKARQQSQPAE